MFTLALSSLIDKRTVEYINVACTHAAMVCTCDTRVLMHPLQVQRCVGGVEASARISNTRS